jgi:acetyl-CoA C-acetyltransferase
MNRAVMVNAKRTILARENGQLKYLEPPELVAPLLSALSKNIKGKIDDVILGNIVGPGGNIARVAALEAGLPLTVTGLTIDRQCSAGLEAIRMAGYFIQGGAGTCYIAGGVESPSTSPFLKRARFSPETYGDPDMGVAAEYVARHYNITREKQDAFAQLSYRRSWDAYRSGYFKEETISYGAVDEVFLKERHFNKILERAKPAFIKNGTVTAANSCGIHDGAAVVVMMEEKTSMEQGYLPVLRFIDSETAGVHPHFPGIAPVPAIQALLERNKLTIKDIDLIEINEAFASKIIACSEALNIPLEKLNVCGGALTMGHPYGASGAIMMTRLFYEVQRRKNVKYVLAAIGSGGGVGVAVLFEKAK